MTITTPPTQLNDHLWMLGTAKYPIYVFHDGREATIVEGGVGAVGPLLRDQLEQLGVDRQAVRRVVITHAHPDHVMAVPLFRETFPGITVLASEIAAKTLSVEKAVAFFCKMDDALCCALRDAGEFSPEHRRPPLSEMRISVDETLKDGDTIRTGDVTLVVLHTPGHSDCSLSFHDAESGALIISDASGYFLPEPGFWWPNYFSDYGAYLDSLKRLRELNADTLCLSHNAAIRGGERVKAYFDGAIRATEDYHAFIVEQTQAGKSVRELAEQLGNEVYEVTQLMPLDFFQKNCGILVKQSLKHEGVEQQK
jgi:glyoxylase-like metal-dependent hydrolase (beta-lactamase superfamily II)